jgi:D-amino peptidase
MFNLDPARLTRPATYLSGRHKPGYMMEGLDETFDAVFFVGYHGSISGPPSVLSHTYNPEVISAVRLNGSLVGESGINALVCKAFGVPIALVSGDSITLEEIGGLAPGGICVETKVSVSRFAAHHLHPEDARERIREGARAALERVRAGQLAAPKISAPYELEVDVQTADMAEVASWVKGAERVGNRTVAISSENPEAVFRSFVALTYITRQAGGR